MRTVNGRRVLLQAHRGVCTEYPENTLAAFRAACDQGYDLIELDLKFTQDNQCVVLHDHTLNRTGRTKDGAQLGEEKQNIADWTLDQARRLEYGSWFSPKFAGEQLPLFEQALSLAKERKIPLKIDNVIESFDEEQIEILFRLVEKMDMQELIGFTCTREEYLLKVVSRFDGVTIHYDGEVTADKLSRVAQLSQGHPLVVWLPYPCKRTSWCKMPPLSVERVEMIRSLGARVGAWILGEEEELSEVCRLYGPDIVETTGGLKPDGVEVTK